MTIKELESAALVHSFKSDNKNTLICFSATWCGPCKASKPTLDAMAASYEADPSVDLNCAIAYEHNLAESIHEFQVKAFPTYVLYMANGTKEHGRVQGADFEKIKAMVTEAGCKMDLGQGNTLGGGSGTGTFTISLEEARAQRLAMFEQKNPSTSVASTAGDTTNGDLEEATIVADVVMEEPESTSKDDNMEDAEQVKTKGDVEMNDASATEARKEPEPEMQDPTENLSKEDMTTLTESMGFNLIRAQKGLLNGGGNVAGAVEWLMTHQDDADIDDPVSKVPKKAASYKCNECGKILSNMANLELHANKTGHSDFEECTLIVKPLTEEEKLKKIQEIKSLLKAKRIERENLEKVEDVDREKSRRNMGKKVAKTREEMDRLARQREAKLRKKEKDDFRRERARIRAEIEKDKLERKAHHGKLTSKLGVDGYNPDAIQYDVDADGGPAEHHPHKKLKANVAKIDDYITKVSSYRAGGDGGKCLKILLAYVKNVVDKDEDKFKRIKTDNKVYKTKVKPFVGAKALLVAVGFSANESNDALILADDADKSVLAQTKTKLEAALAAY